MRRFDASPQKITRGLIFIKIFNWRRFYNHNFNNELWTDSDLTYMISAIEEQVKDKMVEVARDSDSDSSQETTTFTEILKTKAAELADSDSYVGFLVDVQVDATATKDAAETLTVVEKFDSVSQSQSESYNISRRRDMLYFTTG